jgi:DNA-binding NarL/FixJ family response regulator
MTAILNPSAPSPNPEFRPGAGARSALIPKYLSPAPRFRTQPDMALRNSGRNCFMTREQLDQILADEANTQSALDILNNREIEVFSLLSQGFSTHHICEELDISPETLGTIKAAIQSKLKLKNEIQLFQFAVKQRVENFTV